MQLRQLRQASINTIVGQDELGNRVVITNDDDTEITLLQKERVTKGRSTEAVEAQGMKWEVLS